jgi:pimeloyl-ACP methyl ester carboxylesterase
MATTAENAKLDRTIRLADGRTLGYAEYGDPAGTPVIFFHGTPGSRRMAVPAWNDTSLGLRLIAPDRPGMGLSSYRADRTILNWSDDVAELADALGLERFVVAGVSGGGPHTLACAYALPDRVIKAGVISGAGEMTPETIGQMHKGNRAIFNLAAKPYGPLVMRGVFGVMGFVAKRWPEKVAGRNAKMMPAADREILADESLAATLSSEMHESYRQGARGVVKEAMLFTKPWGFRLEDIRVPVLLWHGSEDLNAPLAMAKEMERRIPSCTATYYEGDGHLYFLRRWAEIAAALRV